MVGNPYLIALRQSARRPGSMPSAEITAYKRIIRNPQEGKEKKEKNHLIHTGLLMEGARESAAIS